MVTILALWGIALHRGHPRAPAMLVALGASALAGCARALPAHVTDVVGLDPTSLYHLAQIPGMVLLYVALSTAPALQRSESWTRLAERGG